MTWLNQTFETRDSRGLRNGRIIRVWEEDCELDGYRPKQVYVTTILPGMSKGPHMHMRRDSLFCCVRGLVYITLGGAEPRTYASGGKRGPVAVRVPAGTAAEIVCIGDEEALVINVSSGHYDPSDEQEVPNAPA
jgi:dTDP-4-dehydrorhamnose 3,5-epimerase-like enzyme